MGSSLESDYGLVPEKYSKYERGILRRVFVHNSMVRSGPVRFDLCDPLAHSSSLHLSIIVAVLVVMIESKKL